MEGQNQATFTITEDNFKCITVDTTKVRFESDEDFMQKLLASIERWKSKGVRATWVKCAIEHSTLVPLCTKHGYTFHHAQEGYVMMKRWLAALEPDNIPPYACHYLGCGGFVVNDNNQLLVIREKFYSKSHWKLPGGHADRGEDIGAAAQREVLEETGVESEFQCVVTFRHQHEFHFGCSDFYFICLMRPLTQEIKTCQHEIEEARWMDLEEYMSDPSVTDANRYFAQCYVDMKKCGHWSIQEEPVLAYNKKILTKVYSIKPTAQLQ